MALHGEPDHICFAGAASRRLQLRVGNRWDGGTPIHSPLDLQFTALLSGATKTSHSKNSSPPSVLPSAIMLARALRRSLSTSM